MPETLIYIKEKRLLKITSLGEHKVSESKKIIDAVHAHMNLEPSPKKVFIDFTGIKEMPTPDDLMALAEYMVTHDQLKQLSWIILVKEGIQEDILSVTRLLSLRGFDFEFFFDRGVANAALGTF